MPLAVPIERPAGRPVADHDEMVAAEESVPLTCRATGVPETVDWAPGPVTDTGLTVRV
jgi:hypothetical protein